MLPKPPPYAWEQDNLHLHARIQTRARRDEIVGFQDNRLKIRITAPPVDGKANAHLIKFIAKSFGVTRAAITLISGETSRNKRLQILSPTKLPPEITQENPIARS